MQDLIQQQKYKQPSESVNKNSLNALPVFCINKVAPSNTVGLTKLLPKGVCLLICALEGVTGLSVGAWTNNSAPVVKTCKSLLDTKCLIEKISPTLAVKSKASLSSASPTSKLKNCPDLLPQMPSGCDSVPPNQSLF